MADKKRLIDANALREKLQNITADVCQEICEGFYKYGMTRPLVYLAISETPTVDAVEVVRCKDCKQWSRNVGIADSPNGHCFYHDIETNGYDFCSYGERREGDV